MTPISRVLIVISTLVPILLKLILLLTFITNTNIDSLSSTHKPKASHLLHSRDRTVRIIKVNKRNFLLSPVIGNPSLNEARKLLKSLCQIVFL